MKRTLLTFLSLAVIYLSVTSSASGPTASGLSQPTSGCNGPTCHGYVIDSTVLSNLTLKHKATGITVTNGKYVPGEVYTVTINGSYPGSAVFGFYVAAYQYYTVKAGSFSNIPANTKISTLTGGVEVIDQTVPLPASGGAFSTSFDWTAPPYGLYTSSFHLVVNAANGDALADNQDRYMTREFRFTEMSSWPTAVGVINNDIAIDAYPNPATDVLHLVMGNNSAGAYRYTVYNTSGLITAKGQLNSGLNNIAVSTLPAGRHFVAVTNGKQQKVVSFNKL